MSLDTFQELMQSHWCCFELTAAILPEAEIAPASRPDWRKTLLDIILTTREATKQALRAV